MTPAGLEAVADLVAAAWHWAAQPLQLELEVTP